MSALQDTVAIITGASSGIGAATARTLASAGATVVVAARRADRLASLCSDIQASGGRAHAVSADVTVRADVERVVAETRQTFGRVDVLVNNAGIMLLSYFRNLKVEEWDRQIDVNVKGLLYGIAAVLPVMREQKRGHIVNVSSVAGRTVFPGGAVYAATKFAVGAISEGLRAELSPSDGIRVTVIEPGMVQTELATHITDQEVLGARRGGWQNITPLQPEDVAASILYAVSQPPHVNVNEILVRPTTQG